MARFICIALLLIIIGKGGVGLLYAQTNSTTISGEVVYANSAKTPLDSITVFLHNGSGNIVDSTISDSLGLFSFSVIPGMYFLSARNTHQWPWGAVNALDALIVMRHFVELDTLRGIALDAADVNFDTYTNATDAYAIALRFADLPGHSFFADWVHLPDTIVVGANEQVQVLIPFLAMGDVNHSWLEKPFHIPQCDSLRGIINADTSVCKGTSLLLRAKGGLNYLWSSGQIGDSVWITPLSSGHIVLLIDDGLLSCRDSLEILVDTLMPVSTLPSVEVLCQGSSILLDAGSDGDSYLWNTGDTTETILVNAPGVYIVEIRKGSCTIQDSCVLSLASHLSLNLLADKDSLCAGESAHLSVSSGLSYQWAHTVTDTSALTVHPQSTTTYYVSATDQIGCSAVDSISIVVSPLPAFSITTLKDSICQGDSIQAFLTGNLSSYQWDHNLGGGNSKWLMPDSSTTYTVIGTDSNGCSISRSKTIHVKSSPVCQLTATPAVICQGDSTVLTASGALFYQWDNGFGNGSVKTDTPSTDSYYQVSGTNAEGCSSVASVLVKVNPLPALQVTAQNSQVCPGHNTIINVSGASAYQWNNGLGTDSILTVSPSSATSYSVTGTSSASCSATASIQIGVYPVPEIHLTPADTSICAGDSLLINAQGALSYWWYPGIGNGNRPYVGVQRSVQPLVTTTYTVYGNNQYGCVSSDSSRVTVYNNPIVSATATYTDICEGESSDISATGASTYVWDQALGPGSGHTVSPSSTTTYSVTGTDGNGCSATDAVTMLFTPQPDQANAGPDSLEIVGDSVQLYANAPSVGSGQWSVVSGSGAMFSDSTIADTWFYGVSSANYTLIWTITNQCGSTRDTVNISFADTSALTCGGILTDPRDGQQYPTVQIGTQCWMAKNLNVGTMVNGNLNQTNNSTIEKYCYNNDVNNCNTYGGLYQWDEAMGYTTTAGTQGICPTGWHLPTDAEWCTLTTFLDPTVNCNTWGYSGTDAGGKMKETGTTHWDSPNTGATNSSGFTALGAGYRNGNGNFNGLRYYAYFWSSSEFSSSNGIYRTLGYGLASVLRSYSYKSYGFSVRCLRDSVPPCTPQPDQANAGPDSLEIVGDSVQLYANAPSVGSGQWSVVSGSGAMFSDSTIADTWFYGVSSANYTLIWTITNQCGSTRDTVNISFADASALTCGGILTDPRDGQQYPTVQIGTQCWMAKNLNVGTMVNGSSNQTNNSTIEKYCYNNDVNNCNTYGGLYQWDEAMGYTTTAGTQGICPTGWHLPTDAEWCTLTTFLDPTVNCNTWGYSGTDAGGKMKETGTTHWDSPNTGATNSSGFTALGAGYRCYYGYFYDLRYYAYFWSSSEYSSTHGILRYLAYDYASVTRYYGFKAYGFSVRCLRDSVPPCTPQPDQANAGPDSLEIVGDSVQLYANVPSVGSGQWSVVSGSGAMFSDSTIADTWFYGVSSANYTLVWTITNQCGSTRDTVNISFADTSALTCGGILTDPRDGQQYPTVQIGTQCWMAKNLNVGTMVNGSSNQTNNSTIEKYCYNNDVNNCNTYGGLYQWDEAMGYTTTAGSQGICPTGWHLPTDSEWCTLTTFLDPTVNCNTWGYSGTDAAGKMKETGTTHWDSPNTGATNSSGFTALGAGYRHYDGDFGSLRRYAYFWSSSEYSSTRGLYRYLTWYDANVRRYDTYKTYGFSVRCLRSN